MAWKYDSIDRHVPLLLAQFGTLQPGKKPKCEFLLGLGEPFEPNPWDCDNDNINNADLLMASQVAEEEIPECKPQPSTRWGPPTSTIQLEIDTKKHAKTNRLVIIRVDSVVILAVSKPYRER